MRITVIRGVLLVLLVVLGGCRSAAVEEEVADNEELRMLAEADQQDRRDFNPATATEEQRRLMYENDARHRARVEEMLETGAVRTPEDHMNAALIMQHGGDSTAYRIAYELSRDALKMDSTLASARGFMPMAYDRYRLAIGEPQVYATQFTWTEQEGWVMPPVDTTTVTEAERLRMTGRTLAQRRAALQCLNDGGEFNACNGVEL